MDALGSRMHSFGVVLKGSLPTAGWVNFLHAVAKAIHMSAVADPKVWSYPVNGKGGVGQTIVMPITESFLALDTWPDHRGSYLFVCSCRNFDEDEIAAVAHSFELGVMHGQGASFRAELNLK
jgi:S-adenosylmethionine/arginine decarboxylase-like enzyme